MKRFLLCVCTLWLLGAVAAHASLGDDGVFYLQTRDGNETYTVDGSVVFKCYKSSPQTYRDCGVTFFPANPGEVIKATIQEIDLADNAYVLAWTTNIDNIKDRIGKSGSGNPSPYGYMPSGWSVELKGSEGADQVIQSEDASGALSFGYHSSSFPSSYKGFTILVESVALQDMEYAGTNWTSPASLHRGQTDAPLGTLTVTANGGLNPLSLNAVSADFASLEGAVSNVRLLDRRGEVLAQGYSLSYSADYELRSGENIFTVVGDIAPDYVGTITALPAPEVTVAGELRSVASEAVAVEVENAIYMTSQATAFTIGETAGFYDNGGPDGKIAEGFEGSITFVPATEGNKVRIDFDELAIFYNSSAASVGNQDVFRFYNGRTADEANLIATLTDQAKTIKSTSDDGCLTVTLASKTAYPADGWKATVSEFLPGDMTLTGQDYSASGITSASAYDTAVLTGVFTLTTNNILNPLQAEKVALKVSGASVLKAVHVLAMGENTLTEVGSAEVSADGLLTITLADAVLAEGNNVFAITADVLESASNGDVFAITPTAATVSGSETVFTADAQPVVIANIFRHHEGSDLRNIHDTWQFESTQDPSNSYKHLTGTTDCIVTFVPSEGAKAELLFSEFDLYYTTSYYGSKAKFEVYSGRTADASQLLWKLASSDGKPDGRLRSTASDGSITVVFNPNTTSSYYAGKGWKGTVTPFVDHAMSVEGVTVSQPYSGDVAPGATLQNLLDFAIATEGTLDSRRLTAVKLDLKNCRRELTGLHLLAPDAEGNLTEVGSATPGESDEVTISCDFSLTEGSNAFTIAVDINPDVTPDAVIDAKIASITTDAGEVEVADGDPDGSLTAKYIFLMANGNHTVTVNKPIHFYDDGGANGNLTRQGLEGNVTFVPADPAKKIRVTVISYATANTGVLTFYSGRDPEGESLGECRLRSFPELPVVSKADDGSMTVNVSIKSFSYTTYAGWDILVEQYVPGDLYATNVTAANVASASNIRGASDVVMGSVAVAVDGDLNTLSATSLELTVEADDIADVTAVKLWSTGKSDAFVPTGLLATATPDSEGRVRFEFEQSEAAETLGSYYYWLSINIAATAEAGHTVTLIPGEMSFSDGSSLPVETSAAPTTAIRAGFAGGEFVVGPSDAADYPDFATAIDAIADGIEGPVKFLVESGTYAEEINIADIQGTSATNTITITAQSGNAADVVINGSGYVNSGYNAPKWGIVNVRNTPWVTIDHLTLEDLQSRSVQYPYTVYFEDASRHCTLSNCVLSGETSTSYSGLNHVYTSWSAEGNGHNADFLTIEGCSFTGGYVGVYLYGSAGYVRFDPLYGATIRNNSFTDCGSKGIYPYNVEDLTIEGNTFTAGAAVTKTGYYGIDAVRVSGSVDICNNVVINNQSAYSGGIELRGASHGSAERPARIFNNAIAITASGSTSSVGLTINSDCSHIEVAHNSINVNGTAGHGISISNTSNDLADIRFVHNIVRLNAPGSSASYAFHLPKEDKVGELSFSRNAFFSSANNFSNLSATAEGWEAATGDATMIAEEAKFASDSDLHLAEAGSLVAATPMDYITTDLDGNARHEATPTLGAYEYAELSLDKPEMAEGYPAVASTTTSIARLRTKWTVSGRQYMLVQTTDAEAPEVEAIKGGTASDVAADTESIATAGSLTAATAYKAYFYMESAAGVASDVITLSFTTAYPALEVLLDAEQDDIDAGQSIAVEAGVSGGCEPYSYRWFDRNGNLAGTEAVLHAEPTLPEVYTLTVSSADGQTASAFTAVKVFGTTADADFEDNTLAPDSYWWGTGDEDINLFPFFSGSFAFTNYSDPSYQSWMGFAYSNCTATDFASLFPGQFHNVTGHGYNSATFAVVYYTPWYGIDANIEVLANRAGAELSHVYVTNSSYLYNSAMHGDSYAQPFAEGDYHKVIFTGDDPEGTPVECWLADFRSLPGTILTDWQRVDLTPLGKHVRNVKVTTESSNDYVPSYAVLDNLAYAAGSTGIAEADLEAERIVAARVYALDGSLRLSFELPGRLLTGRDLAALAAGIYIVEYTLSDGTTAVRKVAATK